MSVRGDASAAGHTNDRLLIDPYATPEQFKPKFSESRDVRSSDATGTTRS